MRKSLAAILLLICAAALPAAPAPLPRRDPDTSPCGLWCKDGTPYVTLDGDGACRIWLLSDRALEGRWKWVAVEGEAAVHCQAFDSSGTKYGWVFSPADGGLRPTCYSWPLGGVLRRVR
jgi:hypothetical protein